MGSVVRTPGSHTTAAMASTRAIVATGPAALSSLKAAINRTGLQHTAVVNNCLDQRLWSGAIVACCGYFWFLTVDFHWPSKDPLMEALCLSLSKLRVRCAEGKVACCLTAAPCTAEGLEDYEKRHFGVPATHTGSAARHQELLLQFCCYLSQFKGVQTLPLSPNRSIADATLHSDSSCSTPDIHALLVM